MADYYKLLQVSPEASLDVIKMAYKALMKKYHPDVFEGDKNYAENMTRKINEAYTVLSNPKNRLGYDNKRKTYESSRKEAEDINVGNSSKRSDSFDKSTETKSDSHAPDDYCTQDDVTKRNPIKQEPQRTGCLFGFLGLLFSLIESIFSGIKSLLTIVIVVIIIYLIYTGQLSDLANSLWGNIQDKGNQAVYNVDDMIDGIEKDDPRYTVKEYLNYIKEVDEGGAISCTNNKDLMEKTSSIVSVHSQFNNPNQMGYEMMKEARKFEYQMEKPVYTEKDEKATVNIKLKNMDLYSIFSDTTLQFSDAYYEIATDYSSEEIFSDEDEKELFEKLLNENIKKNDSEKVEFTVQFSLSLNEGKWIISKIDDEIDFLNGTTGNIEKVIDNLLDTGEEALNTDDANKEDKESN